MMMMSRDGAPTFRWRGRCRNWIGVQTVFLDELMRSVKTSHARWRARWREKIDERTERQWTVGRRHAPLEREGDDLVKSTNARRGLVIK
jgi:hypothetical protein